MSAETRSLLPDWHQRPIPWRVIIYHVDDLANYLTENSPKVRALSRQHPRFTPDEWKPLDLKPHVFPVHRRSSCLTEYEPGTTTDPGVFKW